VRSERFVHAPAGLVLTAFAMWQISASSPCISRCAEAAMNALPSPLVGEGVAPGSRSEHGKWRRMRGVGRSSALEHPSSVSASPSHLLPQGEKERRVALSENFSPILSPPLPPMR
jgi:hypothetical protein